MPTERTEAWDQCNDLARSADILDVLYADLTKLGLVGEHRTAKAPLPRGHQPTSRPAGLCWGEGAIMAGKSFVVESVLKFFPQPGSTRSPQ